MKPDQTFNKDSNEPYKNIRVNEAAFESFFKEHFKAFCAFCQYKFGFDLDTSKEVVHIGFIKLWETRQTIPTDLPIKAYLFKIIINNSLDILKHQKIKHRHKTHYLQNSTEDYSQTEFENIDFRQLEADISKAVSELPEQMRRIFELSRYEELKYSQIAEHLNISVKTVETQMGRALIKLRHRLSDYLTLYTIGLIMLVLIKK